MDFNADSVTSVMTEIVAKSSLGNDPARGVVNVNTINLALARCGAGKNSTLTASEALVSSLAPMRLIGLTGGVFNFAGGLGGITVPLVVGYLAQGYGFAPALVYISAVALIGALSYILLVGDVKRVG